MVLHRQGRQQLAAAIVCLSLSIVAVAIRFWCKLIVKNGFHWDDWWILAAVLTYAGGQSANIWGQSLESLEENVFLLIKRRVQVSSLVQEAWNCHNLPLSWPRRPRWRSLESLRIT